MVVAHMLLALIYGWVIPPYEAHDETGHTAVIDHIVLTHELPVTNKKSTVFLDQSHQPPLYYLSVAALTFWIDRSDRFQPQRNGFAFDGSNRHGTRILLPAANSDTSGTVWALRAGRVISALMGGITLSLIALSGSVIFATRPSLRLLATAIAAFNPQALFMGAMVNNDAMIALLGAALAYVMLTIITQQRAILTIEKNKFVWLGVLLGLSLLSKRSAYGLVLLGGLLIVWLGWRQRWRLAQWLQRAGLTFGLAALISAPYFGRNLFLYGRLIADRSENNPFPNAPSMGDIATGVGVAWRDGWLPRLIINGHQTFWGTFGWGNIRMPDGAYWVLAGFVVLAVIGWVLRFIRPRQASQPTSPVLDAAEVYVGLIAFVLCTISLPLAQALFFQNPDLFVGRYLMPALGPTAMLIALGWGYLFSWLKPRAQTTIHAGLTGALVVQALAIPAFILSPAYYTPITQTRDSTSLLNFDNTIKVTTVSGSTFIANDPDGLRPYARVTLDWQVLRPISQTLAFGISVLGRDGEVLGQTNVFPAKGNHPSSRWQVGDHWQDSYDIQLMKPCAKLPTLARVAVAVFPFVDSSASDRALVTPKNLPALDGEGRATTPVIGRFRVDPWPLHYIFWQPPLGTLGHIALRTIEPNLPITASAGSTVTLALTYETIRSSQQDGRAFVHVLDAHQQMIAQDDHAPVNGSFPTDLWQPGWCDRETFNLALPITATGTLRVVTGFYSADGMRFTTTPTHTENLLELGQIKVK